MACASESKFLSVDRVLHSVGLLTPLFVNNITRMNNGQKALNGRGLTVHIVSSSFLQFAAVSCS